ncbi:MAG: ABC transporter ATP-binding protein [Steroidobacteraceae bacterium]|jgi:ABC-2 type transport system ATP-binding protein
MRSPPQPSAEAPRELAAPAVIEMQEVSKAYGPFAALQGLSLSVPAGSVFALLGASGAGKTTAIKILLNILSASSGTVRILGVESSAIGPAELAQIGYVSENQSLPARLEVRQFFEYVRAAYATWDRDLEESLREQLRLPPKRKIGELSHGMRLKMALACALPFRPKLLVLDEPLSGLDALARDEIIGGFLQQAGRMSILISSHELDEVERFATHVAFLHEGRLLFQGTVAALGEHALPLLRSAGDKGLERVSLRRIFVAMVGAAAMARRQSPAGRGG